MLPILKIGDRPRLSSLGYGQVYENAVCPLFLQQSLSSTGAILFAFLSPVDRSSIVTL